MAAGVLVNPWVLGALFAPDGTINGEHRVIFILFVEAACVLSGAALLWTRHPGALRPVLSSVWTAAATAVSLAAVIVGLGWGIWAYRSAHHHTTDMASNAAPTEEQRAWADQFVRRSFESATRHGWLDFERARADGFEQQWDDREHYFNRAFLFDDKILDPDRPEFVMYQDTPRGKLLMGFMYYARSLDEQGPRPGGSITTWHYHSWAPRGYCAEQSLLVIGRPDDQGHCAVGVHVTRSGEMLHVWFVDHPLGPYADAMVFPGTGTGLDLTHLHPIAVHFTVALIVVAVLLDLLAWFRGSGALHTAAFANLVLAAVSAIVTVGFGMAAEISLLIRHDVHTVLDTHKQLGFAGLAGVLALLVWRLANRGRFPARAGGVAHLAAGVVVSATVLAAGYVGAQLVYEHGLAVRAIDRMALERFERSVYGGQPALSVGAPAAGTAAPAADDNPHAGH